MRVLMGRTGSFLRSLRAVESLEEKYGLYKSHKGKTKFKCSVYGTVVKDTTFWMQLQGLGQAIYEEGICGGKGLPNGLQMGRRGWGG